jgi:hypothetical protein
VDLIIENVRCFTGEHVAPLAPVTLLVGENSSGKSTLLAMARVAWDSLSKWDLIDFNEEPFRLGAFDDIVTTTHAARCNTFTVGFKFPPRSIGTKAGSTRLAQPIEIRTVYSGKDAQPSLVEWSIRSGDYAIRHIVPTSSDEKEPVLYIDSPSAKLSLTPRDLPMAPSVMAIARNWHYFRMRMKSDTPGLFGKQLGKSPEPKDLDVLDLLLSSVDFVLHLGRPFAVAPIRTEPERTYDPLTDKPTPQGKHVPMMLAKLMATRPNDPKFKALLTSLHSFGAAAGLFQSLDIKRMGGTEANLPFQLRIGIGDSPHFNLIDVGYGVSQVLPILVDAITNNGKMVLLQQPEVHLHPMAQAELGSFLGKLAAEHRSAPIIIETHSDYLLDRICMDIRDKKGIQAQDVIILYLSRTDTGVKIASIAIDDNGNLIDPPANYRAFFLAEERRYLQG